MSASRPLSEWDLVGEDLSRPLMVLHVDEEVDETSGLRRGTADVAAESAGHVEQAEKLLGADRELYLKSLDGRVYLITLDHLLGSWVQRFPEGTLIGKGTRPEYLTDARPLDELHVRQFVWHERARPLL